MDLYLIIGFTNKYMKAIFLDFDGVITTLKSGWNFDIEKMKMVKRIIDETDSFIVISSSWRKNTVEDTINLITGASKCYTGTPLLFPDRVIGVTRRMFSSSYDGEIKCSRVPRGFEILEYLNSNPDITNYVILDDDSDMLLEQRDHFIKTHPYYGISEKDVEQAIKILNMNVEFTTTETIADEQILKAFGEVLCYEEGVFDKESFFESIENSLDMCGLTITDASKKGITEQLKVLLVKLIERL